MRDESFRIERILTIFVFISLVLVIFTALNFFGVFNSDKLGDEYCIFPNNFECLSNVVTETKISFVIVPEQDTYSLNIVSRDECTQFSTDFAEEGSEIQVDLTCDNLGSGGSTYEGILDVSYTPIGSSIITKKAEIKDIIQ